MTHMLGIISMTNHSFSTKNITEMLKITDDEYVRIFVALGKLVFNAFQ